MSLPTETTALEAVFEDSLFTGAYLSGTKDPAELPPIGKKVLDTRDKLQGAVNVRTKARDRATLANVAQAIAWDGLRSPVESLERQVDAFFDKDRKGYSGVLVQTPSALLRVPESSREEAFKPLVEFAKQTGLQGKVAAAAKAFLSAWDEYREAATRSAAAQAEFAKAVEAVATAKHGVVVAMRSADGSLRSINAENPKAGRKFFRGQQKAARVLKKKGAGTQAGADAGGTATRPASSGQPAEADAGADGAGSKGEK